MSTNKTELSISGLSVEVDGKTKYRLDAACVKKGELPDNKIFVYDIGVATEPNTDVFVGIAEAGDFGLYVNSREEALRTGQLRYRDSFVSRVYESIEEVAAAKRALSDFVNQLVLDYIEYKTYIEPHTELELPTETPSYITELKNNFLQALSDYTTKKSDYSTSVTAYNDAKTSYTTANTQYNTWVGIEAGVNGVNQAFIQFITTVTSEPGITEHPNLVTAAQIANTAYNSFQTTVGNIQTQKTTSQAAVASAAADIASKSEAMYSKYSVCKAAYDFAAAELEKVKPYDLEWYNTQKEILGNPPQAPES